MRGRAMLRNVFTKAVWDQRRSFLAWAVAVGLVVAMYAAFYPSMNTPEMARSLEAFSPEVLRAMGMTDVSSPVGYLESSVFALVVPILVLVFAAGLGARTVAADEETGTLDLVLAHPVGRVALALERLAAALVGMLVFCAGVWLALVATNGPAELDLGAGDHAAMAVHLAMLGMTFTALGFAVGAVTGRRAPAVGAVAVVGVVAYACNTVVPMIEGMGWVRRASAFYYYAESSPLRGGVDLGHLGVLLAATLVLVGAGTVVFDRRDIAT
ncbi:MAG: ABC transporter permease subunit [Streptosporangiales bacterium]|nr:ABC transporter permease subunit [Streptosporangiales bacterium]